MPKLNRDGVSIYYEVHGTGPAVLLTHGFSATSRMWSGQIEAISRNRKLILWDMRGHGQTDSPKDPGAYSEAETIRDMAAVLDAVGVERALVGGLSLGGYMSLAFRLVYPQRVAALLLCDTGPGFKKDEARDAWNRFAQDVGTKLENRGLDYLRSWSKEANPAEHKTAEGLARAASGMLTQADARIINSLPSIDVPTLVVVGSEDKQYLPAGEYMASKIPLARHMVIGAAGHSVNIDQPDAFNEAVLGFMAQVEGP